MMSSIWLILLDQWWLNSFFGYRWFHFFFDFWYNFAAWSSCWITILSGTSSSFDRGLNWGWNILNLKSWVLNVIVTTSIFNLRKSSFWFTCLNFWFSSNNFSFHLILFLCNLLFCCTSDRLMSTVWDALCLFFLAFFNSSVNRWVTTMCRWRKIFNVCFFSLLFSFNNFCLSLLFSFNNFCLCFSIFLYQSSSEWARSHISVWWDHAAWWSSWWAVCSIASSSLDGSLDWRSLDSWLCLMWRNIIIMSLS